MIFFQVFVPPLYLYKIMCYVEKQIMCYMGTAFYPYTIF